MHVTHDKRRERKKREGEKNLIFIFFLQYFNSNIFRILRETRAFGISSISAFLVARERITIPL